MEATKKKKDKGSSKAKKDAEMEGDEQQAEGAMITALCWVSRGYAKAVIDEDEQMAENVGKHSKMIKKLAK
jgi:hypothetical protein